MQFVVPAQTRGTGSIKGKVKVETGTAAGVAVVVRSGEQEVRAWRPTKGAAFSVRVAARNVWSNFSETWI